MSSLVTHIQATPPLARTPAHVAVKPVCRSVGVPPMASVSATPVSRCISPFRCASPMAAPSPVLCDSNLRGTSGYRVRTPPQRAAQTVARSAAEADGSVDHAIWRVDDTEEQPKPRLTAKEPAALGAASKTADDLEMGFVCDQLATIRAEMAAMQAELQSSRCMLDQERALRESLSQELQQAQACSSTSEPPPGQGESSVKEALNTRSRANEKLKSELQKLRQGVTVSVPVAGPPAAPVERQPPPASAEAAAVSKNDELVASQISTLSGKIAAIDTRIQKLDMLGTKFATKVQSLDEHVTAHDTQLTESRTAVSDLKESKTAAEDELTRIAGLVKQLIKSEAETRDDRLEKLETSIARIDGLEKLEATVARMETNQVANAASASPASSSSLDELQARFDREASLRSSQVAQLVSQCSSYEAALESDRAAWKEKAKDLSKQLHDAMEQIQSKQAAQLSDDTDRFLQSRNNALADQLQESVNEVRQLLQKELALQIPKLTEDLAGRLEEEMAVRSTEMSKLLKSIVEMREPMAQLQSRIESLETEHIVLSTNMSQLADKFATIRTDCSEQVVSEVATWAQELHELMAGEQKTRSTAFQNLSAESSEFAQLAQQAQKSDAVLVELQRALEAEKQHRENLFSDVCSLVESEAKSREEADLSLSAAMQKAGEALEESLEEALQKHSLKPKEEKDIPELTQTDIEVLSLRLEDCTSTFSKRADASESLIGELQCDVAAVRKETSENFDHLSRQIDKEAAAREEADLSLTIALESKKQDLLQDLKKSSTDIAQVEESKALSADVDVMKKALAQVVDVFRKEHEQLREECCDAIQNAALQPDCWQHKGQSSASSKTGPIRRV